MLEMSDQERISRAVKSLRNFIRDKKQLNKLLMGQYESSDEELRQALLNALIDWNQSPPPIGVVSLANHPNKNLLIQGAAIQALTGAGIWHSREHMPSQDGGTSADDHAKANEYTAWIERLYQDYEKKKSDLKMSINISMALEGQGLSSEYAYAFGFTVYGEVW